MVTSFCTEASGNKDATVRTGASVGIITTGSVPLSGGLND